MFTIHDTRMTGCPKLVTAATPEGAWALADALGIPRESALVFPVVTDHSEFHTAADALRDVERREAAERVEAIGLLFADLGPEAVASAVRGAA